MERNKNLGGDKNKILFDKNLKKIFEKLVAEIEKTKKDIDAQAVFEAAGKRLQSIGVSSVFFITDNKQKKLILKNFNIVDPTLIPIKKINEIPFDRLIKYKKVLKNKKSFFCKNRILELKKTLPELKYLLDQTKELNSIISPLLLKGEVIGFFEIFSSKLSKENILTVDFFSKNFVNIVANLILFREIKETDKKYRALFENARKGFLIINGEKEKYTAVNKALTKITEYSEPELLKMNYIKIFAPSERKRIKGHVKERLSGKFSSKKAPLSYETKILTKDGNKKIVRVTVTGIINENEWFTVVEDLTEQKNTEEALKESETKYKTLFESTNNGIAVYDVINGGEDFVFKEFNKAAQRLEKLKKEDVVGKNVKKIFKEIGQTEILKTFKKVWDTGKTKNLQFYFYDKNNKKKWRDVYVYKFGENEIITSYQDTTEKMKAQEGVRESEEKYRTLFEKSAEGIVITNIKTKKIKHVNPTICKMLGYSKKELVNMDIYNIHPPKDLPSILSKFEEQTKGKKFEILSIPCLKKNGKIINVDIHTTTAIIDGEECNINFFIDITERKKQEESLKASEQKYKALFDNSLDAIIIFDKKGFITFANKAFLDLSEYSRKHLGKLHLSKIIHLDQYNDIASQIQKIISGEVNSGINEFKILTKKRKLKSVEWTLAPIIENEKIVGAQAMIRDLTERKKAEEEIRKLNEFNQRILDNVPVSILVCDKNGKVTLANKFFYKISGRKKTYVGANMHDSEFNKREKLIEKYKNLFSDGESFYKKRCSFKGVWDDSRKIFVNLLAVPYKNKKNQIEGAITIFWDDTEAIMAKQKLEELNKNLEKIVETRTRQLNESNKKLQKVLELKTIFTADVAHELRTPLTIMQGNIDLVNLETKNNLKNKNCEIQENVSLIQKEINKMSEILRDLATLTNIELNPNETKKEKVNLNLLLNDVYLSAKMLAAEKKTKIETNIPKENIFILGDEEKLERLFLNITENAIKYTEDKGKIKISLEEKKGNIEVVIEDNGIGIPKEDLPNIFQRFYRVDNSRSNKSGGTGLGLAICKWIAQAHQGKIEVESTPGKGSKFVVLLPTSTEKIKNSLFG